jgi:hypothetical protein
VLVGKPADGGPPMIDLRATITGTDAVRGSILYGLAWLAGDADSLGSVRALGYDIDVSKEHERPCANGPANRACVERARRLATLLDATLALDNPDERLSFRQGTAALGVAPDCVAGATQITSSLASASSPGVSVDLSIDASLGDQQIALEKAGRGDGDKYITIKLKDIIVTRQSAHPETIDLNVTITGEDRGPGSLLYALAWLGGATDPLGAVRALGYDVAVANPHVHSCPNRLQSHTCEDAARNLATLMDAALGLGDPAQRAQFRRDASAIGVAPDCSARTSVNN